MGRVRRAPMSAREKAELWTRWRQGESLASIARSLERGVGALYPVVTATGGMPPPPRTRSGRVLSLVEREELSRGLARGDSLRQIGRQLRRAPSTISREVRRYGGRREYRAAGADRGAWARARRPKRCRLAQSHLLCTLVAKKLTLDWSPQQMSQWLRGTFPDDPELHVSHETIYRSLYVQSRGVLKRELIAHLRRRHRLRRAHPATRTPAPQPRNRRRRLNPRAARRGRRPGGPGALGRGPPDRGAQLAHRDPGRTPDALRAVGAGAEQRDTHGRGRVEDRSRRTARGVDGLADVGSGERVCGASALHRGDKR